MHSMLVGNSFPLSLIRRRVVIEPRPVEAFRQCLRTSCVRSFWGHANTLAAAGTFAGTDLTPRKERPAVLLSGDGFPMLEGQVFTECWILSPSYREGFRPAVGEEVAGEDIENWQVLHMEWEG